MPFSLMNGLSAMGAGIAQFAGTAGLEAQRADLAQQQLQLANQLATTRELTVQASSQAFQGAQTDKTLAANAALETQREGGANTRNAATIAAENVRAANTIAAQKELERWKLSQPPETIRALQYLGALPGGPWTGGGSTPSTSGGSTPSTSGGSSPPLPGPRATGGIDANGRVVPPLPGAGSAIASPSATPGATTSPSTAMDNPMVRKLLGLPQPGSEDAVRRAIAGDVAADNDFKDKTPGEQAAEVEQRLAVAKGTMIPPKARDTNAQAIANYQLEPVAPGSRAPGAAQIMARALEINPDYDAKFYPVALKTRESVANGPLGAGITAANTVMQHANEFRENAEALNNGRIPAFNWIANTVLDATGSPRPLSLQETVSALASEARRVYAGNSGGTQADLDAWEKNFPLNGSPAQQNQAMRELTVLLRGRLTAVADQINNGMPGTKSKITGLGLLNPSAYAAYQRLTAPPDAASPTAPTAPAAERKGAMTTAEIADTITAARDAITRGAPRDVVIERLRQNGIDPSRVFASPPSGAAPMTGQD